jgi:hypothetical protein
MTTEETTQRNWIPLAVAAGLIAAVVAAAFLLNGRPRPAVIVNQVNAAPDPYAANLPITNIAMSESSNLAGGKVTYIDGHIANTGQRTVTDVQIRILFRNSANEVAQNQIMPLTVIRMREPYIDTASMAALPLKPGAQQDFRLIFDSTAPDWAGSLPEIRIIHVRSQ